MFESVSQCRACDTPFAAPLLDLGMIPVGDALSSSPHDMTSQAPLVVHYCDACLLLQLEYHLIPERIFNHQYPYFSSNIASLVARMGDLAAQLIAEYAPDVARPVVEIASNDGYFLQHLKHHGYRTLGIEPCTPQADIAIAKGVPTINAFFTRALAQQILAKHGKLHLIVANNVVAHVPDIHDLLAGIGLLLDANGTAVVEFHHALPMLGQRQFDTLYHQHIFYYSLTSFKGLLANHGLHVNKVEQIEAYGGSLRIHFGHQPRQDDSVRTLLDVENMLLKQASITQFAASFYAAPRALKQLVESLHHQGKKIAGYGAAAKASTLLAISELDAPQLSYVLDKNPAKHGLFMPASGLRIESIDMLRNAPVDYLIVFAWNYADEIMAELAWFRAQGGRFVLPHPSLRVID
ncbi:SAM-dependent methyltransferase [Arenicella chitinivorans]|uniref:SAM-dependent methyltransferase n=1 Tax=Arenicella chitinivorans TaxID=1329800 RepID=A0A918VQ48_9GAMM|nr:class I SAM-dependent methyltransferase [Arenicella chitinivorans]GHA18712.1 SAM-dependent methyltransferase [Arenicella chitinivorans]